MRAAGRLRKIEVETVLLEAPLVASHDVPRSGLIRSGSGSNTPTHDAHTHAHTHTRTHAQTKYDVITSKAHVERDAPAATAAGVAAAATRVVAAAAAAVAAAAAAVDGDGGMAYLHEMLLAEGARAHPTHTEDSRERAQHA